MPGLTVRERFGLLRRHFFLVFAFVVLAGMLVAGGWKLATAKNGGQGGGGAAAQGPGGGGGGGGGGGQGGRSGGGRGGPGGPAQVAVAQAQVRAFTDAIDVLGVAKGRQSVTLTAATTQLVQNVRFRDGQTVARGAVLVELKSTEQGADVAQAQARLVQAERAYQRWRTLGERGFASRASIDQYEAAYRTAQADVRAAQSRQADRMIRAPFSGVVGLSDVTPGALVNPGAPIVTLDDLSSVRVDFPVPEQYLSQLRVGQPVEARADAYPEETFRGRIAQLDTRVDERTRSITARAEFPNPGQRLKPGMMIRVAISRGLRQGLAVPETALAVQGSSAYVYVLRRQGQRTVTEQRPVITGLRQNGFVEIVDGLSTGEQIVRDGLNKVQAGQPVRIAGQRPQGGGQAPGQNRS